MGSLFPFDELPSCDGHVVAWSAHGIGRPVRPCDCGSTAWVAMRPDVFLGLSTPLLVPRTSLDWLRRRMSEGAAIHPPRLVLWFASEVRAPGVIAHDGRHRAMLAGTLVRASPIPVLLVFRGPSETARSWTSAAALAREGMRSQRSGRMSPGPLFGEAFEGEDGFFEAGPSPPFRRSGRSRKTVPATAAGFLRLRRMPRGPCSPRRGRAGVGLRSRSA